jgi:hypothetical protein
MFALIIQTICACAASLAQRLCPDCLVARQISSLPERERLIAVFPLCSLWGADEGSRRSRKTSTTMEYTLDVFDRTSLELVVVFASVMVMGSGFLILFGRN